MELLVVVLERLAEDQSVLRAESRLEDDDRARTVPVDCGRVVVDVRREALGLPVGGGGRVTEYGGRGQTDRVVDAVHAGDAGAERGGQQAEAGDRDPGPTDRDDGEPGMADGEVSVDGDRDHSHDGERDAGRDEELVGLADDVRFHVEVRVFHVDGEGDDETAGDEVDHGQRQDEDGRDESVLPLREHAQYERVAHRSGHAEHRK